MTNATMAKIVCCIAVPSLGAVAFGRHPQIAIEPGGKVRIPRAFAFTECHPFLLCARPHESANLPLLPQEDRILANAILRYYLRDDHAGGGHEIQRGSRQPWQAWFKSPTWKAIKRHRLMQEPNCRYCAQEGCAVIATHVGHVDPHGGQWSRFIQYENTPSLCARHHRQLKKRPACSCDN